MLDENLPTFFSRQSSDNARTTVVYFTQNGNEPVPEYLFKRPHPTNPQSRNKFAVAFEDARSENVLYAEVLMEPEWQQPSLSAAEVRALNGTNPPLVPLVPDGFTVQLYNPDQQVAVRGEKSTWTGKESWEFEMPQQSFRLPSTSKLDRQQSDPVASDLTPKIMFRWKRDSKFSKDLTCYMCGKSLGGKKSKEPDITIALYKQGREPALTIYEPNLQRVEVEDRKGLEVVLLLGAEVIRDIYLFPNRNSFNLNGAAGPRKNSKPLPIGHTNTHKPSLTPVVDPYAMSGGLGNMAPAKTTSPITQQPTSPLDARTQHDIDAETKRLQAMVAREEREERERDRRDNAEQKRIKKMLEEEDKTRRRREAEVAKETERLRKQYGIQGQDFPAATDRPVLPPRPSPQPQLQPPHRPVSAGPSHHGGWWFGAGPGLPPPLQQYKPGRPRGCSTDAPSAPKLKTKKSVFF